MGYKLKVYQIFVDGKNYGGIRAKNKVSALLRAKRQYGKGVNIRIGRKL